MKNLFEAARVEEVKERIARLRPESERQWGKVNAAQAVAHCSAGLELALADRIPPRMLLGRIIGRMVKPKVRGPMRQNAPTVKGHVVQDKRDLGTERERLCGLIDRFAALVETIDKAHHSKDTDAIVAPYAQDAVVCDLAPPLCHRGTDLQAKQAWLDTWEGPIDRESRDLNITVSGDFAFCHGFYRLGGTPKAAGRPISFWMRATVCLNRDGGAWRIVHEHTSVPFYMDGSLRPAFDLQPWNTVGASQ